MIQLEDDMKKTDIFAIIILTVWTVMTLFAGLKWGETKGLREQDSRVILELRENYSNSLKFIQWTAKLDSSGIILKNARKFGYLE